MEIRFSCKIVSSTRAPRESCLYLLFVTLLFRISPHN